MAATMVKTDLLNGLADEDGDRVLALGRRILLASGAELFHLGDQADCIYVIAQGRLRLTLPMQVRGQEQNVLALPDPRQLETVPVTGADSPASFPTLTGPRFATGRTPKNRNQQTRFVR